MDMDDSATVSLVLPDHPQEESVSDADQRQPAAAHEEMRSAQQWQPA